ncbi:MAG TPA: PilT/PilU family type 4a pilus ATPase [Vicinamibacterales bacterium]|nr:PilT/PilU family type 4a pilus ATPase [Vicinamibacterales bacterium]
MSDDLDRLAEELEQLRTEAPRGISRLEPWLRTVAERQASDLLLVAGEAPALRIHGRVVRGDITPLDGVEIEDMVLPELPPHAQRAYRDQGIADASRKVPGIGRFRINLHRERGRAAANIRMLPSKVPALASLDLPPGADALPRLPRGLVLIGGATGSGKTTTLAAIVDDINRREAKHIITIEDPIEYEHANHKSIIQQVEIGVDAPDFPTALRSALRQGPDVIVIGEMRDPETMRIALAAGETGHLVLSTLHTTDVPSTLARMTDSFPSERQPTIRQEIAAALTAVFVQTLLPRQAGGRIPAAELLVVSYGARQHIRRNALQHLHQEITITKKLGSFSLEESLARLVKAGLVERSEAALRANHPEDFEHALG